MILYRYKEKTQVSFSYDVNGEPDSNPLHHYNIALEEYPVFKETPKGYWVMNGNVAKWVNKHTVGRYAYPTKLEAIENFIARKKVQIRIYQARLNKAHEYLDMGQALKLNILTDE